MFLASGRSGSDRDPTRERSNNDKTRSSKFALINRRQTDGEALIMLRFGRLSIHSIWLCLQSDVRGRFLQYMGAANEDRFSGRGGAPKR